MWHFWWHWAESLLYIPNQRATKINKKSKTNKKMQWSKRRININVIKNTNAGLFSLLWKNNNINKTLKMTLNIHLFLSWNALIGYFPIKITLTSHKMCICWFCNQYNIHFLRPGKSTVSNLNLEKLLYITNWATDSLFLALVIFCSCFWNM